MKIQFILGMLAFTVFVSCRKNDSGNKNAPTHDKPTADFNFQLINAGILPCSVSFRDSSKNATSYKWNFGDGHTAFESNTSNTYNEAKAYYVTLVVSNEYGKDSVTKKVEITLSKPKPDFTFSISDDGKGPITVSFTNSTVNGTSYQWDFGDGNKSTINNPKNSYTISMSYNVKLVAVNAAGKDSVTKKIDITVVKPKANFSFSVNDDGKVPVTVNFTNSSANGTSYQWDFGDGKKSTLDNPANNYATTKNYNVKLVAINAVGKDSIVKSVPITIKVPQAAFTYIAANNGLAPATVQFTSTSKYGSTYNWSFGDGGTSTEASPSHLYTQSGRHRVRLVVTNTSGSDAAEQIITINPPVNTVRVILVTPTDRAFNQKYYDALKACAINMQNWYKTQMNGKTFTLTNPIVDTVRGLHTYTWYNQNNGSYSGTDPRFYGYYNTIYEINQLFGNLNTNAYMYAIYVAAPGGGAGGTGYCALGDQDLDGLLGANPENRDPNRWIGGSAHEWGHAFGLPHPDNQSPQALMWTGYLTYPNCILQQADKDILNKSIFLK